MSGGRTALLAPLRADGTWELLPLEEVELSELETYPLVPRPHDEPGRSDSAVASFRLCPGCRSLDGEHTFGPTCTLTEPYVPLARPTISEVDFDRWTDEVPAPLGTNWVLDPAATSDRLRLFRSGSGEIGVVYPDGTWCVDHPDGQYGYVVVGNTGAGVPAAMREMLRQAQLAGWDLGVVLVDPQTSVVARARAMLANVDAAKHGEPWAALVRELLEELDRAQTTRVDYLRPEVRAFAALMETKLRQRDQLLGRTGWKSCDVDDMLERVHEEITEFRFAEKAWRETSDDCTEEHAKRVVDELVDIANFAMMVADLFGFFDKKAGR